MLSEKYDAGWLAAAAHLGVRPEDLALESRLWVAQDGRFVGVNESDGVPRCYVPVRVPPHPPTRVNDLSSLEEG